jgi:hypothetical protein
MNPTKNRGVYSGALGVISQKSKTKRFIQSRYKEATYNVSSEIFYYRYYTNNI